MGQASREDISDIGSKLKTAQASIGLAAEILGRPDVFSSCSSADVYKFEKQIRAVRNGLFATGYFADVAWEVMVDLFVADTENRKLSIADLAERNDVPLSTLLRYLARMEKDELIYRIPDTHDKRRIFIKLTPVAKEKLMHVADSAKSTLGYPLTGIAPMSAS